MTRRGNPYKKKLHNNGRFYGKYKEKPNREISKEDYERALQGKRLQSGHKPKFVKQRRDKSFLAFSFLVGTRKMEPTGMLKEDMVITETHIHAMVPVFKHGERADVLRIRRSNVGAELIVEQWKKTKKGKKIWDISPSTAYRIIKRALGVCPHWLRHNWITMHQRILPGSPSEVDRKIMSWTGHKRRESLDSYRLKKKEDIEEIAALEV